jgi:hypothetical protein
MSISEFIQLESKDSEIISKQLDLLHRQNKNLDFFLYVHDKAKSAIKKRLEWELKNQKNKYL